MDAGYHVENQVRGAAGEANGRRRTGKTARNAAEPVMTYLQAVQRHRHGPKTRRHQATEFFRGQGITVGDHAPGEFHFVESAAAALQIRPHQGLAAGDDHHDLMRVFTGILHRFQHLQEVFQGHVPEPRERLAVAAAVPAVKVAPEGAFPENLPERMVLREFLRQVAVQLQAYLMAKVHYFFFSFALAVMVKDP